MLIPTAWSGFLQALQHILVAPSLAKVGNASASRSTRKGRAKIHNIMSVTPAMIAYAACMVSMARTSLLECHH